MKHSFFIFCFLILSCSTFKTSAQVLDDENYIRVDQFGYLPNGYKTAVIAKAIKGFNANAGFELDVAKKVELCTVQNDSTVFSDFATPWNNGATDGYSGDRGWWFNFSGYATEGDYYIKAFKTNGDSVKSYPFSIAETVYNEVLRVAMNMFYYQRVNQDKTAEYASGEKWVDGPWFNRDYQDLNAKYLYDHNQTRDISRGWIDAGDPNKYVTFAVSVVHNLLTTYGTYLDFWDSFDLKIPESNNTVPDILDEIKWEVDWLKNMQDYPGTGGFFIKAGILNDGAYISPPSSDTRNRYYDQICPSASIVGAGMLAHAAYHFKNHDELKDYAADLRVRAIAAWDYYQQSPHKDMECDNGEIEAGDADGPGGHYAKEHIAEATCSAIYLFALTGEEKYNTFVKENYASTRPWKAGAWSVYRTNQGEAIMFYTTLPNADATTKNIIIAKKLSADKSTGSNYEVIEADNLYRAKSIYANWGSNSLLAAQGNDIMDFINHGLNSAYHNAYEERAMSMINYFHGTNPFGMTYLSNMYTYGAELCADEMWHSWFAPGTKYDNINDGNIGPAPGFLSGGFNNQASSNSTVKIGTQTFPGQYTKNQPIQKAFTVENNWQVEPWQFNEPAIYYQSNYVKLLANFVAGTFSPKVRYTLSTSGENGEVDPKGGSYTVGAEVKLTAYANPGFEFDRWSGDFADTINPAFLRMDSDKNIQALFVKQDSSACLIGNAGFESGLRSWINDPQATLSGDAHSGKHALQISTEGEVIDDALIPTGDNRYFTFRFFARKSENAVSASVSVDFFDVEEKRITAIKSYKFSTEYAETIVVNELPLRTAYVRVRIKKDNDKGSLFVDDLCLIFSEINPNAFLLNVENGTGGGYYEENTVVTVEANPPGEGQQFSRWTGDTMYLFSPSESTSRLRMPGKAISVTANYEPIVGVDNITFQSTPKASVFPNPANTYFWVEGINTFDYQINRIDGKQKLSGTANGSSKINIEFLSEGVYILRLRHGNQQQVEKLIVKRSNR